MLSILVNNAAANEQLTVNITQNSTMLLKLLGLVETTIKRYLSCHLQFSVNNITISKFQLKIPKIHAFL